MNTVLTSTRSDFPILNQQNNGKRLIYLDNAATTQMPEPVIMAITQYYSKQHANAHRGVHTLSMEATELMESSRKKVARFIGCSNSDNIIFTSGTTESINLIATMMKEFVHQNDQILITNAEHHSNYLPWQNLCKYNAAELVVTDIGTEGNVSVETIEDKISDTTKLIAINRISNVTGVENPIKEIVSMAHKHGIPVLVDAAQSIREIPENVKESGIDFLCFSAHKMLGPTGVGVLYVSDEIRDKLMPTKYGGGMVSYQDQSGRFVFERPPLLFEAGTPNISGIVGLGAAIDYIQNIDQNWIMQRERNLLSETYRLLTGISGIKIIGSNSYKAGCISFNIDGVHPFDIGVFLNERGIAVRTGHHCASPLHRSLGIDGSVRISPAFYNTEDELRYAVDAIEKAIGLLL